MLRFLEGAEKPQGWKANPALQAVTPALMAWRD